MITNPNVEEIKDLGYRILDLGDRSAAERVMHWQEEANRFLYYLKESVRAVDTITTPAGFALQKEQIEVLEVEADLSDVEEFQGLEALKEGNTSFIQK